MDKQDKFTQLVREFRSGELFRYQMVHFDDLGKLRERVIEVGSKVSAMD